MIMEDSPGIAYCPTTPQPGMAPNYYKSDYQRYAAAWHAAHCRIPDCEWCKSLCDQGLIISCDQCGHVHHTDWLGWNGQLDDSGRCFVFCPECNPECNPKPMTDPLPDQTILETAQSLGYKFTDGEFYTYCTTASGDRLPAIPLFQYRNRFQLWGLDVLAANHLKNNPPNQ